MSEIRGHSRVGGTPRECSSGYTYQEAGIKNEVTEDCPRHDFWKRAWQDGNASIIRPVGTDVLKPGLSPNFTSAYVECDRQHEAARAELHREQKPPHKIKNDI